MNKSPLKPRQSIKFSCVSGILEKFPHGSVINTYPLYDGNVEGSLVREGNFVIGHTDSYCVYEFWRCVMTDPEQVASVVPHIVPFKNPKMFYVFQDRLEKYPDPFARSAIFFVLNQVSDIGLVSTGEQIKDEPDPMSIANLKRFNTESFHVSFAKETEIEKVFSGLTEEQNLLVFCGDYGMNLFKEGRLKGPEETELDHERVFEFFKNTKGKVVLLYYPSKSVFTKYEDYNIKMFNKWGIATSDRNSCAEVLIANF